MNKKTMTFDEFWKQAYCKGNPKTFYYHRCCDTWNLALTSRNAKSHVTKETFESMLSQLRKNALNIKEAFKGKLLENGGRIKELTFDAHCLCPSHTMTPDVKMIHIGSYS